MTFNNLSSLSTIIIQVPVPFSYLDGVLFQNFPCIEFKFPLNEVQ
jgi:hypothetical protein